MWSAVTIDQRSRRMSACTVSRGRKPYLVLEEARAPFSVFELAGSRTAGLAATVMKNKKKKPRAPCWAHRNPSQDRRQ